MREGRAYRDNATEFGGKLLDIRSAFIDGKPADMPFFFSKQPSFAKA